jgi:signal transduction histidine kinase
MQVAGALANAELYSKRLRLEQEHAERMRLEVENKKLEASNETKAFVISNVSHELRTPLTSVLAFADMLHRNRRNSFTDNELLQISMIRHSGRQLDLLISDLLTMSRMEKGQLDLAYSEFLVSDLLQEIVTVMSSVTQTQGQKLSFTCPDEELTITADRTRLYQVICNLVSNASKYSPESSPIDISCESDGATVSIAIRDYGAGISEEEQKEIFERFRRLDNDATRSQKGTGLGLHIVKSLVELHHGDVEVESYEGLGSVFTIRIPLTPPQSEGLAVA